MAYLDGQPVGMAQLQTLALVNFGHFTSMRVDDGKIKGLTHHMARLRRDCLAVFDTELDTDKVLALLDQVAKDQGTPSFTIRVTVFDPNLDMGHPGSDAHPKVLVTARPAAAGAALGPLAVQCRHFRRELPQVKHIGLFASLGMRRAAQRDGFDDALFLDPESEQVSEGVTWNVGFVTTAGRVVWPKGDVLPGVTMQLLHELGYDNCEAIAEDNLAGMAAAFATNTSVGVRPINRIGEHTYRVDHPQLLKLQAEYAGVIGQPI